LAVIPYRLKRCKMAHSVWGDGIVSRATSAPGEVGE
jgi:hypothetical protein